MCKLSTDVLYMQLQYYYMIYMQRYIDTNAFTLNRFIAINGKSDTVRLLSDSS